MKPSRSILIWSALGLCAVTVFGAMTWLTRNVLAAGRERAMAQHERTLAEARADLEERTRLALWRMDALGAAVVLRENLHPVNHYENLTKSPFLTATDPEVFLHFQIRQGGGLTSPELDEWNAKEAGVAEEVIRERKDRMKQLRDLLAANPLPGDEWTQLNCAILTGETAWNAVPKDAVKEQEFNKKQRSNAEDQSKLRQDLAYQSNSSTNEYAQRAKAVAKNIDNSIINGYAVQEDNAQAAAVTPMPQAVRDAEADVGVPKSMQTLQTIQQMGEMVDVSPMRATWLGGELFLMRQVAKRAPVVMAQGFQNPSVTTKSVQGAWIHAKTLKRQLLAEVADLLPHATLVPVSGSEVAANPLTLVSFPFRLERNESPVAPSMSADGGMSDPLKVGWVAVILAVITTSLLVHGIMRLSERRASFVSAVTHELRTPLTTFRLYSDMLETGAVKEEKRGHYLRVLTREADRLSHLVENVLAFSRIERGNARSNIREIGTEELLGRMSERLESRLEAAGLSLDMDPTPDCRVRVDTVAVEHILFNLIDNAAKYAASGDPQVVTIRVRGAGRFAEVTVCDHGPGIAITEQRRIFQAFHKSAHEAAESKPGVGLGLALSRRLARQMCGDLKCTPAEKGACFILSLPLA